eukprot:COSAG02_NODE_220_length_28426_cov_28.546863_8_plen_81_part_00
MVSLLGKSSMPSGGSEHLDMHAPCQSGDAGSSSTVSYGIIIGSVGIILVLHLSGAITAKGRGKRGKAGQGVKRGRMTKIE